MLSKDEKKVLFRDARLIFYCTLLVSGLIVCAFPFQFSCNIYGALCPFCGMRHAIDYLIKLEFKNAVLSNPLILYVIVIIIDITFIVISKMFRRNKT